MRIIPLAVALVALTACNSQIPDSGKGVGFDSYEEYEAAKRAREEALSGGAIPPADAVSDESPVSGAIAVTGTGTTNTASTTGGEGEDLAAETRAALQATDANSGEAPVDADPGNPAPQTVSTSTGISSENDFSVVGTERSIESDAELIAINRSQYKVIEPTALPKRSANSGPNIVKYALSTKHPRGTKIYTRVGIAKASRYERNCAKYASPDLAQSDFLSQGGPNRDKLGLDPDGDGYACAWDPSPFRKAVGG